MSGIVVEHRPGAERLAELRVSGWPIWEHGIAVFPWTYDAEEVCYLLDGEVVVTPDGGAPVQFGAGDLVTFPAGLACTWDIRVPVRKHYSFR